MRAGGLNFLNAAPSVAHKWRDADLLIRDDRCTRHAATPLTTNAYKRDVRRATINEYGTEVSDAGCRRRVD